MPDWFYQPIYKPIVTRLLDADHAHQLTLLAMSLQSKSPIGRKIFDILARTTAPIIIPDDICTDVFGLTFPTPIGLAPRIDIEGTALPLWSMLGLGFVELGVLDLTDEISANNDPHLLEDYLAIVVNKHDYSASVQEVVTHIDSLPERPVPIGVALHMAHTIETMAILENTVDFFSIPHEIALDKSQLELIRAKTDKTLLLRLIVSQDDSELELAIKNAVRVGFDGCIVVDGQVSDLGDDAIITGAHIRQTSLSWVRWIVDSYGDEFPVIGKGGILSPKDALEFFSAGAKLVQLYEGLIYAGPGLPRRIISEMIHPSDTLNVVEEIPLDDSEENSLEFGTLGWKMILWVGIILVLGGFLGILGGAVFKLLPYELSYLQMSVAELESFFDGRLMGFIFHDRVIYHGALMSYGILYVWLAWFPMHPSRREVWAWWTLLISGTIGACSTYISYVYSDYLDVLYGSLSVFIIGIFYVGLILSFRNLKNPFNLKGFLKSGSPVWIWSPAGIGRLYLLFWAIGTALGGILIFGTGMTRIFVPEDLAYMRTTVETIQNISPKLIPFIAHDRLGFGVTLLAIGCSAIAIIWKGIRPQSKSALFALTLAYLTSNLTAIWVHPIVGYNSLSHLLPFIIKDMAFLFAIFHLYGAMRKSKSVNYFSEL
ncbi:MAG: hypothetical protein Phog2KO_15940 [Phototrophicaceae bacterium]